MLDPQQRPARYRRQQSNCSSRVHHLCDADVFQSRRVGQNSQSFLLHILTGAGVGETKKKRPTYLKDVQPEIVRTFKLEYPVGLANPERRTVISVIG
jgi:hypothetical protein